MTNRTFALLPALALALSLPGVAGAQEAVRAPATPTIRVVATGESRVAPDVAWVELGVETMAPTAGAAAQENARVMERVVQALERAGVPRASIQTQGFTIYPEYEQRPEPTPGEQRIRGYRVSNTVSARVEDVSRIGPLLDAGLAAGANRVNGVRFGLRDPEAARAEALRQAMTRARAEADVIARGLEMSVLRVLDASTTSEPPRFPIVGEAAAADMRLSSYATPIRPGEQTVTAVVTVVFAASSM